MRSSDTAMSSLPSGEVVVQHVLAVIELVLQLVVLLVLANQAIILDVLLKLVGHLLQVTHRTYVQNIVWKRIKMKHGATVKHQRTRVVFGWHVISVKIGFIHVALV